MLCPVDWQKAETFTMAVAATPPQEQKAALKAANFILKIVDLTRVSEGVGKL